VRRVTSVRASLSRCCHIFADAARPPRCSDRIRQPAMPVVGFRYSGLPESIANRVAGFRKGLGESVYVARAASGQAAAPPSAAINSRRAMVAVIYLAPVLKPKTNHTMIEILGWLYRADHTTRCMAGCPHGVTSSGVGR
jgi:hypothetical protein